jgi:type VI secretion system protein ImpA
MARIDVETLLQEISEDLPCGEDLEYDADFGELERATRGKPEQSMGDTLVPAEGPNWKTVQDQAVQLLSRTKDLRVQIYLTRALLDTEGLVGLGDGLNLIGQTLERYWDTVYPQLDPDDDNDPTLRVNTIMSLCDADTVLRALREAPLISSRSFGRFSYRDIAVANGEIAPAESSGGELPDMSAINAAFKECDLEELQATATASREAQERADTIENFVTDKVGSENAPNLAELRNILKPIQRILGEKLSERGAGDPATAPDGEEGAGAMDDGTEPSGGAAGVALGGRIASRDDVVRALDKICEYYQRNEPSSPVPVLLRRAKRLVSKDFMEILRDLVPDGVAQAENIRGADSDDG